MGEKKFQNHAKAVRDIAACVKRFYSIRKPFRIYHGSTNTTRASNKSADNVINTSDLNQILEVRPPESGEDEQCAYALVEPNVGMGSLVDATLRYNLIPPVVMEFPSITTGGGFVGTSAESSSFREGVFDKIIDWVEIVLPNGDIVTASPEDSTFADLFQGAASSFGTLGIVTLLRVRLRRSAEFVRLTYLPVTGMEHACQIMRRCTKDESNEFLDGIMYSRDQGMICAGRLATKDELTADNPIRRFTRAWDPWFYQHVESLLSKASDDQPRVEAVPIRDYLFRYDRGGFWAAKYAFTYFVTPLNFVTRFLLNPLLRPTALFHALHKSGLADQYIVQDVAVPLSRAPDFMCYMHDRWGYYPIWLCPLKITGTPPLFHRKVTKSIEEAAETGVEPELLLNFGLWGPGAADKRDFLLLNRDIEDEVQERGGQKCLYATSYYTENEFWEVYDREKYEQTRKKYYADWLPDVFEKMKVDLSVLDVKSYERYERERTKEMGWTEASIYHLWNTWPFSGIYALAHTILRSDYLITKRNPWSQGWRFGGKKTKIS